MTQHSTPHPDASLLCALSERWSPLTGSPPYEAGISVSASLVHHCWKRRWRKRMTSCCLLLLEQSESELRSGQQRERGALTLELCLTVGGRTHTGQGEAPLQSWLLPLASRRSAGMRHSDELRGSPRLTSPCSGPSSLVALATRE
ncbi:hypothetical protein EYF80_004249 [Liparis tanakae]|uniref:Uncharacterized protein n=1 Tax=Liparis tanakae TaxID=230148 RepID=A0A4Z2J602_9TELE|nr:hypothetical protein EYF80_004249 [Liparis tanakae]